MNSRRPSSLDRPYHRLEFQPPCPPSCSIALQSNPNILPSFDQPETEIWYSAAANWRSVKPTVEKHPTGAPPTWMLVVKARRSAERVSALRTNKYKHMMSGLRAESQFGPTLSLNFMSRRKATSSKRQRTDAIPIFGAPSDADSPSAQNNDNPSSSASSSRTFSPTVVPPLTTICARVFAKNFVKLRGNETLWQNTVQYLQILPDTLVAKVFAMVASSCPTYLPHEVIVTV